MLNKNVICWRTVRYAFETKQVHLGRNVNKGIEGGTPYYLDQEVEHRWNKYCYKVLKTHLKGVKYLKKGGFL